MTIPPVPAIPLDEIFASANSLRSAGLIVEYALGGALAAVRYTEPFTTYDADIFFIPADRGLTAGMPAIYSHLQSLGCSVESEHVLMHGFPVQWLAASPLIEEAVCEAAAVTYEGVPGRVFRLEYLIAIAASVGRSKDHARIEQFFQQADIDRLLLNDILSRHQLNLPKP